MRPSCGRRRTPAHSPPPAHAPPIAFGERLAAKLRAASHARALPSAPAPAPAPGEPLSSGVLWTILRRHHKFSATLRVSERTDRARPRPAARPRGKARPAFSLEQERQPGPMARSMRGPPCCASDWLAGFGARPAGHLRISSGTGVCDSDAAALGLPSPLRGARRAALVVQRPPSGLPCGGGATCFLPAINVCRGRRASVHCDKRRVYNCARPQCRRARTG